MPCTNPFSIPRVIISYARLVWFRGKINPKVIRCVKSPFRSTNTMKLYAPRVIGSCRFVATRVSFITAMIYNLVPNMCATSAQSPQSIPWKSHKFHLVGVGASTHDKNCRGKGDNRGILHRVCVKRRASV